MKNKLISLALVLGVYSAMVSTWLLYDSYIDSRTQEIKEHCKSQTLMSELECYRQYH